jgi:SAM-dependent methyltransferase
MSQFMKDERSTEIPACWSLETGLRGQDRTVDDGWSRYWESLGGTPRFFRAQAREYVRNLDSAVILDPRARVMDFGCGFGFVAELLAPRVGQLFLWDASANMRRHARINVSRHSNVRFVDLSGPHVIQPELVFDLVLVNSVAQYMAPERLSAWLYLWRNMLSPNGIIIVSDLIPPDSNALLDVMDLLKLSLSHDTVCSAVLQCLRDLGRYWIMRRSCPLTRLNPQELAEMGKAAGLRVSCLRRNLTQFTRRYTAVFRAPKQNWHESSYLPA